MVGLYISISIGIIVLVEKGIKRSQDPTSISFIQDLTVLTSCPKGNTIKIQIIFSTHLLFILPKDRQLMMSAEGCL